MVQKRNEICDRALEINIVFPKRVVGVDEKGLGITGRQTGHRIMISSRLNLASWVSPVSRVGEFQCLTNRQLVGRLVVMKTVGAFEAKTHLAELLQKVSEGETILITRRGVPVAKLVTADHQETQDLKEVVRNLREIRKGARLKGTTLRELIDEGRRY